MINILDDGSVFVGSIVNGQKQGKGVYYLLTDMFAGYKIEGEWKDDKLNGSATIFTTTYKQTGNFINDTKTGNFVRTYYDGKYSIITYKDGKCVGDENSFRTYKNCDDKCLKRIKLSVDGNKSVFFMGDVWDNRPFGYGMIYFINGNEFERKVFCSMFVVCKKIAHNNTLRCAGKYLLLGKKT